MSRTSPSTPATVRSLPHTFILAPTAASALFQYFRAADFVDEHDQRRVRGVSRREIAAGDDRRTGRPGVAMGDEVIARLGAVAGGNCRPTIEKPVFSS